MNNEKTTSIFRTERDKKEFVRIFREKTMSGFLDKDKAIDLIIRDYPNLFRQPPTDELEKIAQPTMSDMIRAHARQSNGLSDDFFRRRSDKQKPL
jgi:hypothetical protein